MKILFVAILLLTMSACALPSDAPTNGSTAAPTTVAGPPPPVVPLDQVLSSVRTAESEQKLPTAVTPQQLTLIQKGDISLWGIPGCNPDYEDRSISDIGKCTVGNKDSAKTLVVIGDSNAFMWAQSLDLAGKRNNWKIVVLGKDNCGPAALTYYQYQLARDLVECNDFQTWRMQQIQQLKPAGVLLVGWYGNNTGPNRPLTPEIWRDALIKTIQQLPPGTKAALLDNSPHITINPGDCLSRNPNEITRCAEKAADVVPSAGNDAYQQAAAATGGVFVDDTPWFCGETCPQVIADIVPYSGKYHITHDYGRYLSGVLAEALQPAMA